MEELSQSHFWTFHTSMSVLLAPSAAEITMTTVTLFAFFKIEWHFASKEKVWAIVITPVGLSFGSQAFLPFPLLGWSHMAWNCWVVGGNFGDSNLKSTFQKVKNNTWKIRKCPVFYVDRRAKCRKRSPQKWTPLPWHHGYVGLASMPPLPPYSEPGKTQSSGVLCPSWTPRLIIHHYHQTPQILNFFFTSW